MYRWAREAELKRREAKAASMAAHEAEVAVAEARVAEEELARLDEAGLAAERWVGGWGWGCLEDVGWEVGRVMGAHVVM
jgi:hypothetical protein